MIEAGILLGLSREIATDLVVQTMLGTAKLLRDEKMHPVELREMVTSPGGTTIAAIRELEQARRPRRVPERDPGGDEALQGASGGRVRDRLPCCGVELRSADAGRSRVSNPTSASSAMQVRRPVELLSFAPKRDYPRPL